jgi:hypothetical protein
VDGGEVGRLTDPYGSLEFCIGSEDDFTCLDYHVGLVEGVSVAILHSTVNSETSHYIEDSAYVVINTNDSLFKDTCDPEIYIVETAKSLVTSALMWLQPSWFGIDDKPIKHTIVGWNQRPEYFIRAVANNVFKPWRPRKFSGRELRYGGKTIDTWTNHLTMSQ